VPGWSPTPAARSLTALRDDPWEGKKTRDIEAALQVHRGNAKFRKKGDFAYVKDSELLQVAFDLSLLDKTEKDTLGQNLALRMGAATQPNTTPARTKLRALSRMWGDRLPLGGG
jgi:hypothetical protein